MDNNKVLFAGVVVVVLIIVAVTFYFLKVSDKASTVGIKKPDSLMELERVTKEREGSLSQSPGIVGGGYDKMMAQVGDKIRSIEQVYPETKDFTATPGQRIERESKDGIYYFAYLVQKSDGPGYDRATCFKVDKDNVAMKTGELDSTTIGNAQVIGPITCTPLGNIDIGA